MKIAIIGAGAMGSIFAAYLHQSGQDVVLVERNRAQVKTISQNGLRIEGLRGELTLPVPISADSRTLGTMDLVIVMVKAYDTHAAIEQHCELIGPHTSVLSLQNGFGNVETIAEMVPPENIMAGTTTMGGFLKALGFAHHAGDGKTHIGPYSPDCDMSKVEAVADIFQQAGIRTKLQSKVMELIWTKLIYNSAINPVCALLQVRNGAIADIEQVRQLSIELLEEGRKVAGAYGVDLDRDIMLEKVLRIARNTYTNRNSMLSDLTQGKKTEIDFINGAVVKLAQEKGLDTPFNKSMQMLIKALENIPADLRVIPA